MHSSVLIRLGALVVLTAALTAAAPAFAQDAPAPSKPPAKEPKAGAGALDLGRDILAAAEEKDRSVLLLRARALKGDDRASLVRWIKGQAEDPRVGRLLTLLDDQSSTTAAALAKIAATPRDMPFTASPNYKALELLAMQQKASDSIPHLLEASLTSPDGDVAMAHANALLELVKEGPDAEEISASRLESIFSQTLERSLRGLDAAGLKRARNLVSDWIAHTDRLRDVLQELRPLFRRDPMFVDALMEGVPKRIRVLKRPILLARALELNRRMKLPQDKRDVLPPIEEWLEDHVRRDKQLSRLAQRLKDEDRELEKLLLSILDDAETPKVQLRILDLARVYAKDANSPWIGGLIRLMESKDREVSNRAYQFLRQVTGENIGQDVRLWRKWFESGN